MQAFWFAFYLYRLYLGEGKSDMVEIFDKVYYESIVSDDIALTEDILDFANMVFSISYKSVNFSRLMPKAYIPKRYSKVRHHMIREYDKLRALVDVYPLKLKQIDGEATCELTAGYIGTVCVHPNSRGKNYMIELMERAEANAGKENLDMLILDGNRHRYQHYGFEKAGMKYDFNIRFKNMEHSHQRIYGDDAGAKYTFEMIDTKCDYLDELYALYNKRNVVARECEDFLLCLKSGLSDTYAILEDDKCVGYINISEDESYINEIELKDESEVIKVLYDFMDEMVLSSINILTGADEISKISYFEKMCDGYNITQSHQIKILNYERVLEFLFKWKQKYSRLTDGEFTIRVVKSSYVENASENISEIGIYTITILNGKISVVQSEKEEDVVFDENELVKMLTTTYSYQESGNTESKLEKAPMGWFPLPFYLPDGDAF